MGADFSVDAKARVAQPTHCSSSFAAAGLVVIEGRALPCLKAPLLRRGSRAAQGNGEYGQRCVFLVGPDVLIGPFSGGPVCRPYEGNRNLILHPARATARAAPTASREHIRNPGGRVLDPPLRRTQKAVPSVVGAGSRPARGRGTPQGGFSRPSADSPSAPPLQDSRASSKFWVGESLGAPAVDDSGKKVTLIRLAYARHLPPWRGKARAADSRPYEGNRNLIPHPARATARAAPTASREHI